MKVAPANASVELRDRASRIRLACFDVDGTLTDGRLYYDSEGRESKAFHVLDGQGLVLLRGAGVAVALITARKSKAAEHRAADLGVQVFTGAKDKWAQVQALCAEQGMAPEQVCFMGDDLPDLRAMQSVGLGVAPCNAHAWVAARAHHVTAARGGEGAVRELCDLLLDAQGRSEAVLAEWTR